jgi:signal transduction histidine kinase
MTWYETPVSTTMVMFFMLLLTVAFQMFIALNAGDLLREERATRLIRLLYSLLAVISAILSLETILAIASVEGGIYLVIPTLPRYMAALPALLFLYTMRTPVKLPPQLRPSVLSFFVPLLHLPPMDLLPQPLPFACAVFAAAWLMLDAVWMLLSFRNYTRMEVTRGVMAHIMRGIGHGICVANRRGWVLEANPAFVCLCDRLNLPKIEKVEELDASLNVQCDAGRMNMTVLDNSQSIETSNSVFSLQRSHFSVGRKTFMHLTLSDVTDINRAARELEQENDKLARKNMDLEAVLVNTGQEEFVRERERLCRAAHDLWSQRLAVAGLSVDILLEQNKTQFDNCNLEEIASMLEVPVATESWRTSSEISEILQDFIHLYGKLGVEIQISGQAAFSDREQEVLCAVLREALANAVRHAYARHISVCFAEDGETASVTILNKCLDDKTDVTEGRGLHDIKERIRQANGSVQYFKGNYFELKIIFLKSQMNT